jgi:glycosyltransferase involved in cell wall biosynthesis
MRVAVVTTSWPTHPGDPAGHFVHAEARDLERAGHDVVVVAPEPDGAFGWPGVAARLREQPLRAISAAAWVVRARTIVLKLAAERVVAHWAVPSAWPIACAAAGAELEVVSHGGDVRLLARMPGPVLDRMASAIARRATTWRFVSDALQRQLLDRLGAPARARVQRIAVVRAASIDMPDIAGVRAAAAALRLDLGGRRAAVSVGRLVPGKRVDLAIEHLARSRAADALIVVGDGPERPRLERLARSLRLDARFVGVVTRERALAWIAAADFLVHASEAEGLSTVLREAAALGTPVLRLGA